ncbi:MAG: chemotaxis protein CheX [Candidatus Margulisbacteria bacterium]|nr:chemotaxis protein CheX [Candidatus Margulisiibacteriota bacterium]
MNVEYINPFLVAISNVLKEVIPDIKVTRGQLIKRNTPMITKGCASLIGITGDVEGRVVFDMLKQTAVNIASSMNGEKFETFDYMVSSTINEMANMICGGAITILNNNGKNLDISAPTIFTGQDLELYDSSMLSEAIIVPINTDLGEIFVNVAIREN